MLFSESRRHGKFILLEVIDSVHSTRWFGLVRHWFRFDNQVRYIYHEILIHSFIFLCIQCLDIISIVQLLINDIVSGGVLLFKLKRFQAYCNWNHIFGEVSLCRFFCVLGMVKYHYKINKCEFVHLFRQKWSRAISYQSRVKYQAQSHLEITKQNVNSTQFSGFIFSYIDKTNVFSKRQQ